MSDETRTFTKHGLSDEVEHKRFPFSGGVAEAKQVNVEESTFEGFSAGIGNRDQGNDIIMPGAFQKSINERVDAQKVKLLDGHSSWSTRSLFGMAIDAEERSLEATERKTVADMLDVPVDEAPTHRLWTKFLVSQKQDAQEALQDVAEGILDGLSIGFRTVRTEFEVDEEVAESNPDADAELLWLRNQGGVRKIHELAWWETSLVVWGMNRAALTIPNSVKSLLAKVSDMQEGDEPVDEKQVRYAIRSLKQLIGDVEEDPRLVELEELEKAREDVAEAIETVEKQNEVPSDAREMIVTLYDNYADMTETASRTGTTYTDTFDFTVWVGEELQKARDTDSEEEEEKELMECNECGTKVSDQPEDQLNDDGLCLSCENEDAKSDEANITLSEDDIDAIAQLQEKVGRLESVVSKLAESEDPDEDEAKAEADEDEADESDDADTEDAEEKSEADEDAAEEAKSEDSETEETEGKSEEEDSTPEADEEEVAGDAGEHKSEEDEDSDGHSDERFEKGDNDEGEVLENALSKLKIIELEEQTGG